MNESHAKRLIKLCKELATEEICKDKHEEAKKVIKSLFEDSTDHLNDAKIALAILEPYKTAGRNDIYFALSKFIEFSENKDSNSLKDTLRILNVTWN